MNEIRASQVSPPDRLPNADYISLLKIAVTASAYPESGWTLIRGDLRRGYLGLLKTLMLKFLSRHNFVLVKQQPLDLSRREAGEDWPLFGFSMVGHRRLENLEECLRRVERDRVKGDYVECGVWRGGASIFAKGVLNALGDSERSVWLADSFEGMPEQKDADRVDADLARDRYLAVSLDQVVQNFERFGLLDDRVKFVKGWFSESLAKSDIREIAILRLDGDYYSSTMDALNALYDRVSVGGYIIVDDYGAFKSCKQAIHDFCRNRKIAPEMVPIDRCGAYWRKTEPGVVTEA